MQISRSMAIALLPALAMAASEANGAELQPPIPLYSPTVSLASAAEATNPPGSLTSCPPLQPTAGPLVPGRLIVRNTDRPDVGPYVVKLPGYGSGPAGSGQDSYRPLLVTANPGDTLRFDVVNELTADEALGGVVNLHTHGLITSPRPCTPLGDYIYVTDQPGTTTSYRIDLPLTLPAGMFSSSTPMRYPSGLQWFHAHVHEKGKRDVNAGQAGLLYIGDLVADLLAAPNIDASTAGRLRNAQVRYLALRDIQLAVPAGATPDKARPGQRADWLAEDDYNPNACVAYANPPIPIPGQFAGPGYCGHRGATMTGATDYGKDTVWLFTINGQRDPTVTMEPERDEIWRLANLSADTTYVLELADQETGALQPFTLLSLDGAASGTASQAGGALNIGVAQTRHLLMPASRAELLIANAGGATGRRLVLRTIGITTGASGSRFPRIDLAHVTMPPGPEPVASASPLNASAPMMAPTADVPRSAFAGAAPANCIVLPDAAQPLRRRIAFSVDPTGREFLIGSEIVTAAGLPVNPQRNAIPPRPFPMAAMLAPDSVVHVCPQLGRQEVWEVVNYTGELHNFHIHQSKFRLTRPGDPGAPPNLVPFQDPAAVVAQYLPYAQGGTDTVVWHDVLPLPPYGGRLFVTIPFYAPEQIGNFVYHCHILSHEDKGMMAVVQVFDPANVAAIDADKQFASLLASSVCRLPEPEVATR